MVGKNVRCECPYARGMKLTLHKNEYTCSQRSGKRVIIPRIIQDIENAALSLVECGVVCIVSHGLKVIGIREKLEHLTCEETLTGIAKNTQDSHAETGEPVVLSEIQTPDEPTETDEKMFGRTEPLGRSWANVITSTSTNFVDMIHFSLTTDKLEVPTEVFEAFDETDADCLVLEFSFGLEICIERSNVESRQDRGYVFGRVVLKHVRYMVIMEEEGKNVVHIGPLTARKSFISRHNPFNMFARLFRTK